MALWLCARHVLAAIVNYPDACLLNAEAVVSCVNPGMQGMALAGSLSGVASLETRSAATCGMIGLSPFQWPMQALAQMAARYVHVIEQHSFP
jgi:hypothetical protein